MSRAQKIENIKNSYTASQWALVVKDALSKKLHGQELVDIQFISKATRSPAYLTARKLGKVSDCFFQDVVTRNLHEENNKKTLEIIAASKHVDIFKLSSSSLEIRLDNLLVYTFTETSPRETFFQITQKIHTAKYPSICMKLSELEHKKVCSLAKENKKSDSEPKATYRLRTQKTDEQRLLEQTPYVELFSNCLKFGKDSGVSDIHFESKSNCTVIRMRRHGKFFIWQTIGKEYAQPFFNHVKKCCNLNLGVTRTSQDTRISLPNWDLDVRVNSMPTLHGERIVLRLLDLSKSFDLAKSGFHEKNLNALRQSLDHKNGLILVTGPTGSGKTTTLYSLLCELDHSSCNIITIENPVEYSFSGISQVQVSENFGFKDAIRAILRQDPDVILVGEIRDQETASLCLEASATGHLVLSTLHTNGALEAVSRLVGLGVDKQLIGENLRFCATQQLTPIQCNECATSTEADQLKCTSCQGGIVGRYPDIEYLTQNQIQAYVQHSKQPQYKRLSRLAAHSPGRNAS